jgi:RNA polymerase sigma-70 factor, ECF subfamily
MISSDNRSDEELAQRALADPDEYGRLIERYEGKLRRFVRSISSLEDVDIDDVLQETFLKAWRNLRGFDAGLSWSAWIYRIARNATVSHHRKSLTREGVCVPLEDEDAERLADNLTPHLALRDTERKRSIDRAFESLPDKLQSVAYLALIEGRSYDEISDIVERPPGTVATWIHRAKKHLQASLETHHE